MASRHPSIFYGWWVVATAVVGLFWGVPVVVFTFPVFVKPLMHDFHVGRVAVSLGYTLQSVAAGFGAPLAGWLIDRNRARQVILPAAAMFGAVLMFNRAFSHSIWQLYFFYVALGLCVNGVGPIPYGKVISHWFDRRRGVALGLMMLGIGSGALVMPSLAQELITRFGWHMAFTILGSAVLFIPMPIVSLFLKEGPQDLGLSPDGLPSENCAVDSDLQGISACDAWRTRTFWFMLCAFFLMGASVQGCLVHMVAMLTDRGVTVQTAALGSSLMGGAVLIGRVGTGICLIGFLRLMWRLSSLAARRSASQRSGSEDRYRLSSRAASSSDWGWAQKSTSSLI
jgi:MFS family permease